MANPNTSLMIQLAQKISAETEKFDRYLRENDLPNPGFDVDAPSDFPQLPDDIQRSRLAIINASRDLAFLAQGPRECVRWEVWSYLDTLSLQIVNSYKIANLVPFDKPISLKELSTKTPLGPTNLARTLRHAMTNRIFCEPCPGFIAHTAASRVLAEDEALGSWVGYNAEDNFPAASRVLTALRTYPEATSLMRTGFNVAWDTVDKEAMFTTLGKYPARAKRMGQAMSSLTGGEGYEVSYFVDNYDMSDFDQSEGTFVDMGGSHGFVCVDLAKRWKNMKFIVQDLPKTVDSAPKPLCEDESVSKRIQLQAHDFFTKQPCNGADVFYFRWIMHNYSTPYAVSILQKLIPAMKPGARVVINEHCLLPYGQEDPSDERIIRGMDMVMLALLNAQERHEQEFRELFALADKRFKFKGVTRPEHCRMSVVEAVWDPEAGDGCDGSAVKGE